MIKFSSFQDGVGTWGMVAQLARAEKVVSNYVPNTPIVCYNLPDDACPVALSPMSELEALQDDTTLWMSLFCFCCAVTCCFVGLSSVAMEGPGAKIFRALKKSSGYEALKPSEEYEADLRDGSDREEQMQPLSRERWGVNS